MEETGVEGFHVERGVPEKVKRRNRIRTVFEFVMAVGLVVAFVIAGLALKAVNETKASQKRSECGFVLIADFMIGVGEGFGTPPAPNPDRNLATGDIFQAYRDLLKYRAICGSGHVPEPRTPSLPLPTTTGAK